MGLCGDYHGAAKSQPWLILWSDGSDGHGFYCRGPRGATCIGHKPGHGLRLGQPLWVPAKQMCRSPAAESQGIDARAGHIEGRVRTDHETTARESNEVHEL